MRHVLASLLVIAAAARAGHADPKPERVHREAISPGDAWWCWSAGALSGCMRTEEQCHEVENAMGAVTQDLGSRAAAAGVTDVPSMDGATPCTRTAAVCVRTGMAGTEWRSHVTPSRAQCEQAPGWGVGLFAHESACERWRETESPPDRAVVPAGKGWWCYAATIAGAPSSICARTRSWCEVAYGISHADGSAPACKPVKRAFVFTSPAAFHAFGDADACARANDAEDAASSCAVMP